MESDDDILERLAKDGSMDFSNWPIVLPGLVKRIEENAHTQFAVPDLPNRTLSPAPAPRFFGPLPPSTNFERPHTSSPPAESQEDKENAGPASSADTVTNQTSSLPVATGRGARAVPNLIQPPIAPGSLPGPIAKMLDGITSTILNNFTNYPPHTIQRLAELVLRPKQHYRSLTGYLHALDRVVHVTSGSNIYPLPPTFFSMGDASSVTNGEDASNGTALGTALIPSNTSMDDEEALGGALLTPIPWLSSQSNGVGDSEDGMGSEDGSIDSPVSTRSDPAMQPQASPPQQQQQQASPSRNPSARPQIHTDNTETIEGPNGTGTIETVSVSMVNGVPTMTSTSTSSTNSNSNNSNNNNNNTVLASRGVTQGELLRQEQRAGVVPLTQLVRQQQQEARAQAEIYSNNNNNNPTEDTDSPMEGDNDHDPEPDVEMPHARGPDAIDDADIGPQRASTSHPAVYTIGTTPEGATIQMQSIDIEAAVGRHVDGTPIDEPRRTTSAEHDAETTVPQSPKRDAEDNHDGTTASKKQKIGEISGEEGKKKDDAAEQEVQKEGEDTVMVSEDVPSIPNGEAEEGEKMVEKDEEVKGDEKDAEGDVVLRDPDPIEVSSTGTEKEETKREGEEREKEAEDGEKKESST